MQFFVKLCDTEFKGVSNKYLGADSESQTDGEAGRYDSHALNKGRPKQNTVHADCSIVANFGTYIPAIFCGIFGVTVSGISKRFNVSSKMCTLCYTIYDVYQLLHVSAPRCHPQGAIISKVDKPISHFRFWFSL